MKLKRIIKWFVISAVSLLLVGGVLLFTLDLGFLRGTLEEQVRQATGRDFSIDEGLSIRLGHDLVVHGSNLRLGNTVWAEADDFVSVGGFDVIIDARSLLQGPILIRQLDLRGLNASFEQNTAGQANWQITTSDPEPDSEAGSLAFLFEEISVSDSSITIRNPALDQTLHARIDRLDQSLETDGLIHLKLVGELNGERVEIESTVGPYANLLSGNDLSVEGAGRFGRVTIEGNASFDNIWSPRQPVVNLNVSGPDFEELTSMIGISGLGSGDLNLRIISSTINDSLAVKVDGNLGQFLVGINSRMHSLPEWGNATIDVQLSGPNMVPFELALGLKNLPPGAFSFDGRVIADTAGLTNIDIHYETPLANGNVQGTLGGREGFTGSSLQISAAGDDARELGRIFGFEGLAAGPWSVSSGLKDEDAAFFKLENTRFSTRSLSIELKGRVGKESVGKDTDIHFTINGDRLSDFQAMAGKETILPEQAFSISGQATALPETWELTGIQVVAGTTRININGRLSKDYSLAKTILDVEIEGVDPGKMFALPGQARLPDGPFTVVSQLELGEDRLRFSGVDISAGPFNLMLDADLPWPLDMSQGNFAIEVSGEDITRILPELAGLEFDQKDYGIKVDGGWHDGQVTIDQGDIRIGDGSISAHGKLGMPPNLSATDFQVELHFPDLSRLGTVDGSRWNKVSLDLTSSFGGTKTKFLMKQFQAQIGDSTVLGEFELDLEPDVPRFNLRFTSNALNLKPFQEDSAEEPGREPDAGSTKLIPDMAFPMEFLSGVEGTFSIQADRVYLKRGTLQSNTLTGEIRDGGLYIQEIGTDGYTGRLSATFTLEPGADGIARLSTTLHSEDLIINLINQSDEYKKLLPAFNIDIDLVSRGMSFSEAASMLNGTIRVNSPGGQVNNIQNESVSALFLAEILTAISPSAARQDQINISCFAAAIDIHDGEVLLDPGIALQSDKLNIFATGKINLGTEKIDVNFRTETRSAVSVSASELISPYIKLSGTLANPSVALDAKGTLLSGGAAYLSGGLSILAKKVLDQLVGTNDPCAEFLDQKD